jgi:glycosyltransferase involved in cell wall biosynthesis
VAFRGGSVPEVIDEGVTGFIVGTIDEAIDATRRIHLLERSRCRSAFEHRFGVTRMAADYVQLYQQLTATTKGLSDVLEGDHGGSALRRTILYSE